MNQFLIGSALICIPFGLPLLGFLFVKETLLLGLVPTGALIRILFQEELQARLLSDFIGLMLWNVVLYRLARKGIQSNQWSR